MFLPIGDDNSSRTRFPFVVLLLIALNGVMWWLQLTRGEQFTYGYSVVPYEISQGRDLTRVQYAHLGGDRIPIPQAPGPSPIYLTLLSAMFMHGSWMHILGNMLYLYIFGDQIEDLFGHLRFLLFYLLCGVAAACAQIFPETTSVIPCLGASGAIAGVLGAYLLRHPSNRVRVLVWNGVVQLPAVVVLGLWIVFQIFAQISPVEGGGGVAYGAHIGGFVAGVLGALLLGSRRRH